jgi:Tfp pilus assembly protein PilF
MLATAVVYGRVVGFGFVNYDDPTYVLRNDRMAGGLNAGNIAWAFTTFHFNNWHPLTWLTYFATSQVFGITPGPFHAVNLFFHVVNSALLYGLLVRMTGRAGPSAMVAALFELHPLHVESVAWISELKDVLSTFFALLTMHCYVRYVRRGGVGWYLAMCGLFALGLMSKPMIVTLPAVLLLLDYWPMRRLSWKAALEKAPLFAMAAAASLVTLAAQGTAIAGTDHISFGARLSNTIVAYGRYFAHTFVPIRLAVYYPHPAIVGENQSAYVLLAGTTLLALTLIAISQVRTRPYLLMGWLWFIGTLVPVSGLVQVGEQAMADRYTYFPLIGLFIACVWFVAESGFPGKAVVGYLALAGCAIATENQLGYWRDTQALFTHAAAVTRDNYVALDHLAIDDIERGRAADAIPLALESIRINPNSVYGYKALAQADDVLARPADAAAAYHEAISIDPTDAELRNNAGSALAAMGRVGDAEREYDEAIRLNPVSAVAHCNLGILLASQGRLDQAINHWRSALIINPSYTPAREALTAALRETRSRRSTQAEPK